MMELPTTKLPSFVDEGPQRKYHNETATTRRLRRKFQTKAPLRTPLPLVQEETSEDKAGKWEIPICSRKNVHMPQRRGSVGHGSLRRNDLPEMKRKAIANPAA